MGESNDTLTISDYSKAQGSDTVVPVKTTDHPFMFKGDVDISPGHRLSVRYDRIVNTSLNGSQYVRPWSVTTSLNPEGYVFPPRPEPKNSRRGPAGGQDVPSRGQAFCDRVLGDVQRPQL